MTFSSTKWDRFPSSAVMKISMVSRDFFLYGNEEWCMHALMHSGLFRVYFDIYDK